MTFLEKIELLERLDGLIKRKATGTPTQLAKRVNLSKRTLHDVLGVMESMGAPIQYDLSRRTYFYKYNVNFTIGFISDSHVDTSQISGGYFSCIDYGFLHDLNNTKSNFANINSSNF